MIDYVPIGSSSPQSSNPDKLSGQSAGTPGGNPSSNIKATRDTLPSDDDTDQIPGRDATGSSLRRQDRPNLS